jgi:hypothetical protein
MGGDLARPSTTPRCAIALRRRKPNNRSPETHVEGTARSLGGPAGVGQLPGQHGQGAGCYPFDRVTGKRLWGAVDGPVDIPDQAETQCALEILRELR